MNWREWVADFYQQAHTNQDQEQLRLVALFFESYAFRERDPAGFLALCDEGRYLAERLHEPWWVLGFQAKAVQELVHQLRDFRQALERTVALTLEAGKQAYLGCPFRPWIYQDLLAVHFCIDPEGYANHIEEGFREIEQIIPTDFSSRLGLLNLRRWCAEQSRRPEEHNAAAHRALALIAEDPGHYLALHYSTFIYNGLCHVNCAGGGMGGSAGNGSISRGIIPKGGQSRRMGGVVAVAILARVLPRRPAQGPALVAPRMSRHGESGCASSGRLLYRSQPVLRGPGPAAPGPRGAKP